MNHINLTTADVVASITISDAVHAITDILWLPAVPIDL